jgi:hypothetical protein
VWGGRAAGGGEAAEQTGTPAAEQAAVEQAAQAGARPSRWRWSRPSRRARGASAAGGGGARLRVPASRRRWSGDGARMTA